MGSCRSGCGMCCDPVSMPYSREHIMAHSDEPLERAWAAEALVPMPRKEAKALAPQYFGRPLDFIDAGGNVVVTPMFYRCMWFDRETRQCTEYDRRPPVCRDYPWYDFGPHPAATLPTCCGYRVDIGLPVEPIPVHVTITKKEN